MANGNAILAGLLGGFGAAGTGIGNAFAQQQKDDLEREKLAQERDLRQQIIDAQASQFATTQKGLSTPAETLFGYIGMPLPSGMDPKQPIPNALGDNLLKLAADRQKVQQEQAVRGQQANALERLGSARPPELAGQLAEGEDPEAAALIPRTAGTPANARYQALAGLLREGPLTEYLVKALDEENDKKGFSTHFESRPDGTYKITTDPRTGLSRTEKTDVPGKEAPQATAATLYGAAVDALEAAEAQFPKGHPEVVKAALRVDRLKPIMVAEGGSVRGPSGNAPLVDPTPRAPSPGVQQDLSELDARIAGFGKLVEQAKSPEIAPMLGMKGFLGRAGEDWLKLDQLSPEQREFRARAAIELAAVRKIMLGVGQSKPELAQTAPALPGENDPGYAEKLSAWGAWAQQNRDSINSVLSGSNVRVPPQQGAPAPKPAPASTPRSSSGGGPLIVTDGTKRFMWTGTKEELAAQYPSFTEWRP